MNPHPSKENPYASPEAFGFLAEFKREPPSDFDEPIIVMGELTSNDYPVGVARPSHVAPLLPGTICATLFAIVGSFNRDAIFANAWVATAFLLVAWGVTTIMIAVSYRRTAFAPATSAQLDTRRFRATITRHAFELRTEDAICFYRWNGLAISANEYGVNFYELRQGRPFLLQYIPRRLFKQGDWERFEDLRRWGRPSI